MVHPPLLADATNCSQRWKPRACLTPRAADGALRHRVRLRRAQPPAHLPRGAGHERARHQDQARRWRAARPRSPQPPSDGQEEDGEVQAYLWSTYRTSSANRSAKSRGWRPLTWANPVRACSPRFSVQWIGLRSSWPRRPGNDTRDRNRSAVRNAHSDRDLDPQSRAIPRSEHRRRPSSGLGQPKARRGSSRAHGRKAPFTAASLAHQVPA